MPVHPFQLPQLPQFVEFIYFEKVFLPHELELLNTYWDDSESAEAELEGGESYTEDSLRKSSIIGLEPEEKYNWLFERLTNLAHQCNNQMYYFNLSGFYEPLQLAEYGEGDFFDWHLDFGTGSSSNRKISITVQLSEPDAYEGGNLQFQINSKTVDAPRTQGSIVMFPSFIRHRVTPITKGRRRSLVGWVSGIPFK